MDKVVVLFTMEGCPYCVDLKNMLNESSIEYYDRDINEYEEEYNMFVKITENEYVPAFMLIESPDSEKPATDLFAPDRDFQDINEGFDIIKSFLVD